MTTTGSPNPSPPSPSVEKGATAFPPVGDVVTDDKSLVCDLSDSDLATELQLARERRADVLAELVRANARRTELLREQYRRWRAGGVS